MCESETKAGVKKGEIARMMVGGKIHTNMQQEVGLNVNVQ